MVAPYQKLLTELKVETTTKSAIENLKRKIKALRAENKKAKKEDKEKDKNNKEPNGEIEDEDDDDESSNEESEETEISTHEIDQNTFAQEVLCKDTNETEETILNGRYSFSLKFKNKVKKILFNFLKIRFMFTLKEQLKQN